ncbi:MAG: BrnT family toxin [Oscillibacter sp.]|nr:BrnT family toxin [Oscillibacter sp.]
MSLKFEWDEEKARANLKKHGIPFELATKVFLDENRIEIYDEAHSIDEERYITIGLAGEVLFVVYTERHPQIRLISARLATARERKVYYGNI